MAIELLRIRSYVCICIALPKPRSATGKFAAALAIRDSYIADLAKRGGYNDAAILHWENHDTYYFGYVSYHDLTLMSQSYDWNTKPTGVDSETTIALPLLFYTRNSYICSTGSCKYFTYSALLEECHVF